MHVKRHYLAGPINICCLVHCASLMTGSMKDLIERLPKPESAVTGGELGRDGQIFALEADQKLLSALRSHGSPPEAK